MKNISRFAVMSVLALISTSALAQTTAFTYQGRLNDGANPAAGIYDLRFAIYDAASAGTQQGGTLVNTATGVTNGLFTVKLDFGNQFPGADRWLEISVRTNGGGAFATLAPRQALTPTPYAVFAGNVNASGISGTLAPATIGNGTITGSMIATGAVGATQLAPGSVTTGSIADNAVTSPKIFTSAALNSWLTITNPSHIDFEYFGNPVALGSDRVAVGVQNTRDAILGAGAVYLFNTNGTLLRAITNPAPEYADLFGQSLIAFNNDLLLIGAPLDNVVTNDGGAAYLYNTNGVLLTIFTNPAPVIEYTSLSSPDYFGFSLAALGKDRVLIGAEADSGLTYASGLVYLFNTNGALLRTFTNPAPVFNEGFGYSLGVLDENRILIGAPNAKVNGQFVGLIYLYNTNGILLNTFTNPTVATFSNFGLLVRPVGNDRFLTASSTDSAEAPETGRAYLISTNGSVLTVFTNPVPQSGSSFGGALAVLGEGRVAFSAPSRGTVSTVTNFEAVYIFRTNGTLLATITNPVPQAQDRFATAIAPQGNDRLLIASVLDDSGAQDSGVVHLVGLESYAPGLIADGVRNNSISTGDLQDGAVTAAKIDPAIGLWSRLGNNVFRTNGNVGIGISAPLTKLHVKADSADAEISLEAGDAGAHRWTLQSSTASGDTQLNRSFQVIDRTDAARRLLLGTYGNMAVGYSDAAGFASVGMGYFSSASGNYSFAAGYGCLASGGSATALGNGTTAGADSTFAAGTYARALHPGCFVWGDNQFSYFSSTANNQFLIRATGGVGIGTTSPQGSLHVYSANNPTVVRVQSTGTPGFGRIEFVSNPQGDANEWRPAFIQSLDAGGFTGGLAFYVNGTGAGNKFATNEVMRIQNGRVGIGTNAPSTLLQVGAATCNGTTWANASDRNSKENFQALDPLDVLDRVIALPVTRWNYKQETDGTAHIGPMAQDFYTTFGVGSDDTHIATVDADGVALAAIQGLNQKLEKENAALRVRLERLEKLLNERQ